MRRCDNLSLVSQRCVPRPHELVRVTTFDPVGLPCDLGAAAVSSFNSPSLADLLGSLEATWAAEGVRSSDDACPSGQRAPSLLPSSPRPSTSRYVQPTAAVSDDEGVRPPVSGIAAPMVPASPVQDGDVTSPIVADAAVVMSDDEDNAVN